MIPSPLRVALVFALLLATPLAAQAQSDFLMPQGQLPAAFSGSGLSSAFGVTVADVGGANPAALGGFEQTTVGVSYGLGTAAEVASDVEVGPANGLRPQSAAVVFPRGAWTFGVSYSQRYASSMDMCIPRQTPYNPDVESSGWCAEQTARAEVLASQVAYRTIGTSGSTFDLALRLGLGRGSINSEIDNVTGMFSEWGLQFAAGVRYRTDRYGLAVHYEHALRVEGATDYEGGLETPVPTTGPDGQGEIAGFIEDFSFSVAAIPARLSLSTTVDATPTLDIGADLHYAFWQMEDADRYENQIEAAAWARLDLSDRALASFGVWRQGGHPFSRSAFVDDGQAIYLTLGGALTFDRLRLDAAVADSRLLSGAEQRQTLVKVGASVRL
ncbi:MAG: hypothetical protein ABJF88_17725 [Rhodothermales bacterium]